MMTALVEYRPGLWLTELALADLQVRGAVIAGSERTVVWDTLSHPRDMGSVAPLVQGRWSAVVYSHADWDHAWGTAGLPGCSLVIAQDACRVRFAGELPATLRQMQAEQPDRWREVILVPPTLTFGDHVALDLGGLALELHALPGHTPDTIVAFLPNWGILLAGDAVETPLPWINDDSPLDTWMTGLRRWVEDSRVRTVIPAHGNIGGLELIQGNIEYLRSLL